MINERSAKLFCCEDISLIENYYEAVNDKTQTWAIHHKLEIQNFKLVYSKHDLIKLNLYYKRPASELMFIKKSDHSRLHSSLHMLGKTATEKTKSKMSSSHKGFIYSLTTRKKISKKLHGNKNGSANKIKYYWESPTGEVKLMNKSMKNRWHPDWKLIEY